VGERSHLFLAALGDTPVSHLANHLFYVSYSISPFCVLQSRYLSQ
jgi:hypothetical protein